MGFNETALRSLKNEDVNKMLEVIGLTSVEQLFEVIPEQFRVEHFGWSSPPMSEQGLYEYFRDKAKRTVSSLDSDHYLGCGCYDYAVPSVVDALVSRGEFLTAYTPYQPEMSQGLLRGLYEFQHVVSDLTGFGVVTSGHYDGATALGESVLMCKRQSGGHVVLIDRSLFSNYREVLTTYVQAQGLSLIQVSDDADFAEAVEHYGDSIVGLVAQLGSPFVSDSHLIKQLEQAENHGVSRVLLVFPDKFADFDFNLRSLCDVLVFEAQSLGLHMHAGGAHLGVIATVDKYRSQLPGRLVGEVTDLAGNPALALIYEDREQHVARERATSNICSNQALNCLRVAIYCRLKGFSGLTYRRSHALAMADLAELALNDFVEISVRRNINSSEFVVEFINSEIKDRVVSFLRERNVFLGVDSTHEEKLEPSQVMVAFSDKSNFAKIERLKNLLDSFLTPRSASFSFEGSPEIPVDLVDLACVGASQVVSLEGDSEIEIVRKYTEYSRRNFGVDTGSYPLGSCTMKYNFKRNDRFSEREEFLNLHPLLPFDAVEGLVDLYDELSLFIAEILGMDGVDLTPAAGAHGELKGVLAIKQYFAEIGDSRRKIALIPESAHGTNPATAAMAGYQVKLIGIAPNGLIDLEDFRSKLTTEVALVMITNPSTLGVFEEQVGEIISLAHQFGAQCYFDGANMNALMGYTSPGAMGFDVAHINVHKTLGTPHGGGGPGAGPIGVKNHLKPFIDRGFGRSPDAMRVKLYHGHISVLLRALSYIKTLGFEGLKQATSDAVLNANYLMRRLTEAFGVTFSETCMHEFVIDTANLGIPAMDLAKRLIDYGIHPPTIVGGGCVYYGESLKQAMLIEPTESESLKELEYFVSVMSKIIAESTADPQLLAMAPHSLAVSRIVTSHKAFSERYQ